MNLFYINQNQPCRFLDAGFSRIDAKVELAGIVPFVSGKSFYIESPLLVIFFNHFESLFIGHPCLARNTVDPECVASM